MSSQEQQKNNEIRGVITDDDGNDQKKYFVVHLLEDALSFGITRETPITCSYKFWQSESPMQKGMVVLLGPLQLFVKGWRAQYAQPIEFTAKAERK